MSWVTSFKMLFLDSEEREIIVEYTNDSRSETWEVYDEGREVFWTEKFGNLLDKLKSEYGTIDTSHLQKIHSCL